MRSPASSASNGAWWTSAALAIVVSLTAAVALAIMIGGLETGVRAAGVLLRGTPLALAWMVMGFGFGCPIRRLLDPANSWGAPVQLALGVAVAFWLDVTLGSLGLLSMPIVAWGMILIGMALAVMSLRFNPALTVPIDRLAITALPAVAVLLLASASTPGWLWSTEFGGYDALSYHLELPKQWLHDGAMGASTHNVYGHLPSFVEGAFLHLMVLRGDAHAAAPACQMLHALIALAAAWATGAAAGAWSAVGRGGSNRAAEGTTAAIGAALVLVTPWIVVAGSLAYNELATVLMLAAGLAVLGVIIRARRPPGLRDGVALGLLAGAACGAKLTASGLVTAPLALAALLCWFRSPNPARSISRTTIASAAGTLAFFVVLAPWLLRNAFTTGNPLFPFATSSLGRGTWTSEQAAIFAQGHVSTLSTVERVVRLWDQFLRFGVGPAPAPGEPWAPQWGVLPWLGIAAIVVLLVRRRGTMEETPTSDDASESAPRTRFVGSFVAVVLLIQLLFWTFFTHLQSRFLIPTVVPLAIAVAAVVGHRARRSIGIALLVLSLLPVIVFLRERDGAPLAAIDADDILTGDFIETALPRLTQEEQRALRTGAPTAWWLNHALEDAHVLLLGDARPFWYRRRPASYAWQTTWDRGPFSRAIEAGDDPRRWSSVLLDEGFTHVLIDPEMLERWERSGWNDPRLTAAAALRLAEPPNRVLASSPGGVLIELRRE